MNKLMTLIAAGAMTMTAMAQNPDAQNACWEETENWMSASEKIGPTKIDKSFIFELTSDADMLYMSNDAMMIITEIPDADVTTWVEEMEIGIFESGDTYFNLSTEVKAMDGMGYSAFYHGSIAGEPVMMQRFKYVDANGGCYDAMVISENFQTWNNGANSTSYFIASLMKAPQVGFAKAN